MSTCAVRPRPEESGWSSERQRAGTGRIGHRSRRQGPGLWGPGLSGDAHSGRQRSSAAPRTETALSRWLLCDLAETGSSCGQRWAPLRLTRTQQGREGICMRGIIWPTNSGPARIPDLTSPFSPGQKYSFKKQTKPEWWLLHVPTRSLKLLFFTLLPGCGSLVEDHNRTFTANFANGSAVFTGVSQHVQITFDCLSWHFVTWISLLRNAVWSCKDMSH